jgi:hypothetical protein
MIGGVQRRGSGAGPRLARYDVNSGGAWLAVGAFAAFDDDAGAVVARDAFSSADTLVPAGAVDESCVLVNVGPVVTVVDAEGDAYGFAGTNVGDACCARAVRAARTLATVIVSRCSERFVTGRLLVARATGGEHGDVLKEACAEVGGARTRTARGQ